MRVLLVLLLVLSSCRSGGDSAAARERQSPCHALYFEQSRFTVCSERGGTVHIVSSDASGAPLRNFSKLQQILGPNAAKVAFAMNAGMFDENGRAIGLLIERGEQLQKVNRHSGGGNFGLLPNGVFLVQDSGKAEVVETGDFEGGGDLAYATQSGPMLVIDGKLHPKFDADGESRNIRNGVGIGRDGTPLFVISDDAVSFGKFARLFRDKLKAKNALYFDGTVSSLWSPVDGRQDVRAPLGPLVVVFKSAGSAPGREGRARP